MSNATSSWALRRKILIGAIFIVLILLVVGVPSAVVFYTPPTCSDGKQNGGEQGVDCGGPCNLVCSEEASKPIILWQRSLEVSPGVYNAVVLIQNKNNRSTAAFVPYSIKIYDDRSNLLAERKGEVTLLYGRTTPVFEQNIVTGTTIAYRTVFSFTKEPVWFTDSRNVPDIRIIDQRIDREQSAPRIRGVVMNNSVYTLKDLPVIGIVYDPQGTALGVSRTFIDELLPNANQEVVFTWPRPFAASIARIEIIPKIGSFE